MTRLASTGKDFYLSWADAMRVQDPVVLAPTSAVAMREKMPGLVSPPCQAIDQPKMTRREHQIALLIAQGESNNSIAARLNVSLRTIEGRLYRTFIKLDIESREQLAVLMNGESIHNESSLYHS